MTGTNFQASGAVDPALESLLGFWADAGVIGNTDPSVPSSSVVQSQSPRVAAGIGINWKSPMGPISVNVGYPVVREASDKIQIFKLNFGTSF